MFYLLLVLYGKKATQGCPCGYLGDGSERCRCSIEQIKRYRNRISGPLLDRIDMHVEVPRQPIDFDESAASAEAESSQSVSQRVALAIERQHARQHKRNQSLDVRELECHAQADQPSRNLLRQATERLGLSMRAYHRIIKVSRTIADLEDSRGITAKHISEAIGYRRLDRR